MGNTVWKKVEQDPCQKACQNCQTSCEKVIQYGTSESKCQTVCESTNQCGRRQACINCQGRSEESESNTS